MVKVKASLALDRQVHVHKMVSTRGQADEPCYEEYKPLNAGQVRVAVCDNASNNQPWDKIVLLRLYKKPKKISIYHIMCVLCMYRIVYISGLMVSVQGAKYVSMD